MFEENHKGFHVGRRDFIKTTTLASMDAPFPETGIPAQNAAGSPRLAPQGTKRNLLFLSDPRENHDQLIESIKSVKEFDFAVSPIKADYQKQEEIRKSIKGKDADIFFYACRASHLISETLLLPWAIWIFPQ